MKGISVEAKLFYVYLFCDCDHCGIWQVEFEVAKIRLALNDLKEQDVLDYFAGKIIVFDAGSKWFLPQFVLFQYGDLKANNKIHKSVISNLSKFNLLSILEDYDDTKHLPNPLQRVKDKDKVKDKEQDKEMDMVKVNSEQFKIKELTDEFTLTDTIIPPKARKSVKSEGNTEIKKNYTQFMSAYSDFIKSRGLPMLVTQADGMALKSIIKYINSVESVQAGTSISIDIWNYILNNWNKLSTWLQTQIQLRQINSQLPNIIQHLRTNGKQTNNTTSAQQLAEALRGAIQNGGSL